MTLLEIYNKLLRRGCPEHPRLWWKPGARGGIDAFALPLGPRDVLFPHCYALYEADARALITMHALAWFRKDVGEGVIAYPQGAAAFKDHKQGLRDGVAFVPDGDSDILEAIEAATRHLEPKEKP